MSALVQNNSGEEQVKGTTPAPEQVGFYAALHRMRHIKRWGLMQNTATENLSEHSFEVAVLAHALALIRKTYALGTPCPDPDYVAVKALFHDASEIITGDLPTPVKYHNANLKNMYKDLEKEAVAMLLQKLPTELSAHYEAYFAEDSEDEMERATNKLVKAADILSAYIKCIDELKLQNLEFKQAASETWKKLQKLDSPEVSWFLAHAMPVYEKSLDEQEKIGF